MNNTIHSLIMDIRKKKSEAVELQDFLLYCSLKSKEENLMEILDGIKLRSQKLSKIISS